MLPNEAESSLVLRCYLACLDQTRTRSTSSGASTYSSSGRGSSRAASVRRANSSASRHGRAGACGPSPLRGDTHLGLVDDGRLEVPPTGTHLKHALLEAWRTARASRASRDTSAARGRSGRLRTRLASGGGGRAAPGTAPAEAPPGRQSLGTSARSKPRKTAPAELHRVIASGSRVPVVVRHRECAPCARRHGSGPPRSPSRPEPAAGPRGTARRA